MLKLEPSPLRLPTLHSGSSQALPFTYQVHKEVQFSGIFKCAFKIYSYGHKQTSTLQTHFRNAITLVWGSLRLAPITLHEALSPVPWLPRASGRGVAIQTRAMIRLFQVNTGVYLQLNRDVPPTAL